MSDDDNVTILAPAYNEEKNIPLFVEHFLSNIPNGWKILIIDDGSEDESEKVLFQCHFYHVDKENTLSVLEREWYHLFV